MKFLEFFGLGKMKLRGQYIEIASIVALPLFHFLKLSIGDYFYNLFFIMFLIHAIRESVVAGNKEGDAKRIVIDEAVGSATILFFIGTVTIYKMIIAIIIFRYLDRHKPWPISYWQDEKSHVGIVGDDLLAGTITGVLLYFL